MTTRATGTAGTDSGNATSAAADRLARWLRASFGRCAAKKIARAYDVSERQARNWLSGTISSERILQIVINNGPEFGMTILFDRAAVTDYFDSETIILRKQLKLMESRLHAVEQDIGRGRRGDGMGASAAGAVPPSLVALSC